MLQYAYNRQVQPPAPFVHVSVRCAETGKFLQDLPAQLDCGADRTILPLTVVNELGLLSLDELPVGGFGGHIQFVPTFKVDLSIRQLGFHSLEVLAHPDEAFVLIGRDVLNFHRVVLDGPRLSVEID